MQSLRGWKSITSMIRFIPISMRTVITFEQNTTHYPQTNVIENYNDKTDLKANIIKTYLLRVIHHSSKGDEFIWGIVLLHLVREQLSWLWISQCETTCFKQVASRSVSLIHSHYRKCGMRTHRKFASDQPISKHIYGFNHSAFIIGNYRLSIDSFRLWQLYNRLAPKQSSMGIQWANE